jgi:mannose-6-phosphate isomerase-like protein (cupin superfamily)
MVVSRPYIAETASSMGYSLFRPGTVTAQVRHAVEEVAFVVQGRGELILEEGKLAFDSGQALYIPPGVWHAVAATGEEDLVMVFAFPYPEYPPTDRRAG